MRFRSKRGTEVIQQDINDFDNNSITIEMSCSFYSCSFLNFSLTAWPLIRDVFFYSVSLILLVAFFTDEKIHWYEALILLLWYVAYVGFMKFNEDVEDKLRACFGLDPAVRFIM